MLAGGVWRSRSGFLRGGNGNEEAFATADLSRGLQGGEDVAEAFVADGEELAEGGAGHGLLGECFEDSARQGVAEGRVFGGGGTENLDVHGGLGAEGDLDGLGGGVRAVLGVELEPALAAQEVEVAVRPGVQIPGAAKGLAWLGGCGLADVVHHEDGDLVLAL
jgi:hypothetical protein